MAGDKPVDPEREKLEESYRKMKPQKDETKPPLDFEPDFKEFSQIIKEIEDHAIKNGNMDQIERLGGRVSWGTGGNERNGIVHFITVLRAKGESDQRIRAYLLRYRGDTVIKGYLSASKAWENYDPDRWEMLKKRVENI